MSTPALVTAPHVPRTNHTAVCWLVHVRRPASACVLLGLSPRVRYAAVNLSTGRGYLELRWPPARATAVRRLLEGLASAIEPKPLTMTRQEARADVGEPRYETGSWAVGGQGQRTDRLRVQVQDQ